ncbi:MAG: hypothetical protein FJ122_07555 [Deltaproteobacteria bacterium]|nr:hypothetical protein [Deltaproteobacteria bacterium]
MKMWRNLSVICVAAALAFYAVINAFLFFGGKNIIADRIDAISNRKTAIDLCYIVPPLVFVARNVKIEGLMQVDYLSCSLGFLSLFSDKLVLSELVFSKPEIHYEIKPQPSRVVKDRMDISDGKGISGESASDPAAKDTAVAKPEKPLQIALRAIKITQGRFDIIDYGKANIPTTISLRDIDIALDGSGLKLNAVAPWNNARQEGRIEAVGSFKSITKEATAKLNMINLDGAAVYPYYSRWINLAKDGVQNARLDFTANIKAVENTVEAVCTLELSDMVGMSRTRTSLRDKRTFHFNFTGRFTIVKLLLGPIDLILLDGLL